ncbi:sugar kinase [Paenibacillus alkaliterrae]|uniref:sugar kinase n=1 Tax=Paenibacillus alkaliterrae TaxID=320909 RepID=UPI001F2D5688|nr:sugar kinase [Paenibacillus alkaliterrae]MCF2941334.1 sugar kinase [Paenibacillus alkaliterrae]
MAEIITIGEILVEVMAKNIGQSFEETGEFVGPFPSGAPAIFIDQAAKTGSSCMMISKVGNDGFGRLNVERLKADGVDIRYIGTLKDKTTGIAFVTYKENGDRDFIYTMKDSAAASISRQDIEEEMFEGTNFLHIMGCSVFNEEMIAVFRKAIEIAKDKGVKISFDPNIRKEIMKDQSVRDFILFTLDNCDIFLPGEEELKWITGIEDEERAAVSVLNKNAVCVAVKKGSKGCRVYERGASYDVEAYKAIEIDPTGAGDCFAGTFISLLNQGKPVKEAVRYANASGAMAVMMKGPMEGTSNMNQLELFIKSRNRSS